MARLLFFLLGLLWGGSFVAIKIVVAQVPPLWAAALRLISALIFLFIFCKISRIDLTISPRLRKRVWLSGIASQALPFSLLFWGEQSISAGLAGILNGTTALWTFILGMIFLKKQEPFTSRKLWGLLLGLAGLICIFGPKLSVGATHSSTLGAFAVTLMGLSYGVGNLLNKSVMVHPEKPTLDASLLQQTLLSSILVTATAFVLEGPPHLVWFQSFSFVAATLYMGWLSTAVAFILYYRMIYRYGAVQASTVTYIIPIMAVFLDFIINGAVPSGLDSLGTVIILAGVLLVQTQAVKVRSPASTQV